MMGPLTAERNEGLSYGILGDLPDCCQVNVTLSCTPDTRSCGLLLRTDPELNGYYQLRWEPGSKRVVFDRWPRPGDEPFMLERPLYVPEGKAITLKVIVDETIVVAYIDDRVVLSSRAYNRRHGQLGVFVAEGAGTFSRLEVKSVPNMGS